jgi:hypothetical protein
MKKVKVLPKVARIAHMASTEKVWDQLKVTVKTVLKVVSEMFLMVNLAIHLQMTVFYVLQEDTEPRKDYQRLVPVDHVIVASGLKQKD